LGAQVAWPELSPLQKQTVVRFLVQDASRPGSAYEEALAPVTDWDSYKIYLWDMQDTDALERPYAEDAGIILIGDAAHAIMPTIGMGASLAIEDAEILGRRLANYLTTLTHPTHFKRGLQQQVFVPFTSERLPVWKELIRRSRLAAQENFINVSQKKRFAVGPQIPNNSLSRVVSAGEAVLRQLGL
jgi:2-polyprenyl-6-methoxyphenol hydroxylase-like FAD-dependent oxidoreductase